MNKNDKVYLSHDRDYLEQPPQEIKSYSEKDYTKLPDPVTDNIVVNNISCPEFDYTSKDMEEKDF